MSSNFLTWDLPKNNQQSDGAYAADASRANGAPADAIFASALANKAFYQWSIFVAAFGGMLADKGITVSDADFNNLKLALANIITTSDLGSFNLVKNIFADFGTHFHSGSVTRTNIVSTTLPANTLTAGHTLRITIAGTIGSQNSTNQSSIIVNFGNIFPGQLSFNFDQFDTGGQFTLQALINFTGVGSQLSSGFKIGLNGAKPGSNMTDLHINTTLPQLFAVQIQSGAVGDSQSITSVVVELV